MNTQAIWELVKNTFNDWSEDKAPRLAAALAYYTVFAIAPILVIAIAVAKMLGFSGAQDEIVGQVSSVVGQQAGEAIRTMVENRGQSNSTNILATIIGVVTLLVAATGLFGELQDSLNTIWEVAPKLGRKMLYVLRAR